MSQPMPNLRELRFGPPKKRKTTSVVESYPKPLLMLNFQPGGLDSVTQEVTVIQRETLETLSKGKPEELPRITCVNYFEPHRINTGMHKPYYSATQFTRVSTDINLISDPGRCPWATVVLDPLTEFRQAVLLFIGSLNVKGLSMDDARDWAGTSSLKIVEVVGSLYDLPCNAVVIAHEQLVENEKTKEIRILPMAYGQSREILGGMAAQYIYATSVGQGKEEKFVVWTKPQGWVTNLGVRWPRPVEAICGPTYEEIYGSAN